MAIERPRLLMCRPTHFEPAKPDPLHGFANNFEKAGRALFEANPSAFRARAMEEWTALKTVFGRFADVTVIEQDPNLPDQVFTADASFSLRTNGSAISVLSKFTNIQREGEVAVHKALLEADPSRVVHQNPFACEGTGDAVYDPYRDVIWAGYSPNPSRATAHLGRSDHRSHAFLEKTTGVPVRSFQTLNGFYHIDTVLAPLPRGHMLVVEDGLSEEFHRKLNEDAFEQFGLDPDEYKIKVSREDADKFAPNIRCFGNTVIMPECSNELADQIKSKNYELILMDLSAFLAAGGAGHCDSNNIDEERIEGGYHSHPELMPEPCAL